MGAKKTNMTSSVFWNSPDQWAQYPDYSKEMLSQMLTKNLSAVYAKKVMDFNYKETDSLSQIESFYILFSTKDGIVPDFYKWTCRNNMKDEVKIEIPETNISELGKKDIAEIRNCYISNITGTQTSIKLDNG